MILAAGTKLGPYETLSLIGTGNKFANGKSVGIDKQRKKIYKGHIAAWENGQVYDPGARELGWGPIHMESWLTYWWYEEGIREIHFINVEEKKDEAIKDHRDAA
jgi:hypothetical protein